MAAVGSVDVELELIGWLQERLGDGVVVRDELDNLLLDELPTVQVQRLPAGGDDGFRLDRALVDIDVYAATRGEAIALSATIRGALLGELRGSTTSNATWGRIRSDPPPAIRPYQNTGLRRCGATYEMFVHPVS
ncbi:hypothetical protein [Streptomyces qinglanensis]|uniref:DUF3168 domain-containing protein n=1 Tax=Streptomyces qinglanensis TaxID=943816 RepID=A0A1H9U2J7_9ACTN|nr:hypothetical protein [Streptomyces qinglanensis]SES03313.1 hypothetical protein SAMN05421870_107224 [Streptomyces qinglanensis]